MKIHISQYITVLHVFSIVYMLMVTYITVEVLSCIYVLNPIALRAAKTQWNYGLSECSRVKKKQNPFDV